MADMIREFVPNPKKRSKKWISTALSDREINQEFEFASGEYFAKNLVSPVHFYEKLKRLPRDSIIVEISPHSIFKSVISQTLEASNYINLLTKYSKRQEFIQFFVCDHKTL